VPRDLRAAPRTGRVAQDIRHLIFQQTDGIVQRGTRVDQAAQRLVDRIAIGEFEDDAPRPREVDLAAQLEVSRLTVA
jgi:DNA-binding GntR family transcriptional regulator